MRKENLLVFFIALSLIIMSLQGLSFAQSNNPHFKRGMEWMDLKRYESARQEFSLAINQEPKNFEARYQIALSYSLEGDLSSSIKWCVETLSASPRHSKTQKLLTGIYAATEKRLLSSDDQTRATGLVILRELLDRRLISSSPILKEKVLPLLKSASNEVVNRSFALLKRDGIEVEGLSMLANENDPTQRQKALRLITANLDTRYLPVLRVLATDESKSLKEAAALLLLETNGDAAAKLVLAGIYHADLQEEIAVGRTEKGDGVQFHDRISKILKVALKLDDASFAGEFGELICTGRVYGFLATDLMSSISQIGKPGVPYLREVLSKEAEFRDLLRQRGFKQQSKVDWRFNDLRRVIMAFEK